MSEPETGGRIWEKSLALFFSQTGNFVETTPFSLTEFISVGTALGFRVIIIHGVLSSRSKYVSNLRYHIYMYELAFPM